MVNSEVQIANTALARIGCSQFIADLATEKSNEARVCRVFYAQCRDKVLGAFPWPWASRQAALQNIGSPRQGWNYRYRYPSDCITAKAIFPKGGPRLVAAECKIPFAIVEDEANGALAICCDIEDPVLEYTAAITNVRLFSQAFVDTLGWALAAEIASPLSADPKFGQMAGQQYIMALTQAAAVAFNEGQEDPLDRQPCSLLDSRD